MKTDATQQHYGQTSESALCVEWTTYAPRFGYITDTGLRRQVGAETPESALVCGQREVRRAKTQTLKEAIECGAVIGESSEREWNALRSACTLTVFCEIVGESHAREYRHDQVRRQVS